MNKDTLLSCFSRERESDYEREGGRGGRRRRSEFSEMAEKDVEWERGRGGRRRGSEMAEEDVKREREDEYLFSY